MNGGEVEGVGRRFWSVDGPGLGFTGGFHLARASRWDGKATKRQRSWYNGKTTCVSGFRRIIFMRHDRLACWDVRRKLICRLQQKEEMQLTSKQEPNARTASTFQLRPFPATAFPFPFDSFVLWISPTRPVLTTFFSAPTPHMCPQTRSAVVISRFRRARSREGSSRFSDGCGGERVDKDRMSSRR